jgi:RNA-directed DNA polymerase
MIKSKRNLLYLLRGIEWPELKKIIEEKPSYYHSWVQKTKKPDGSIKHREIDATKRRLRYLQLQINERILAKIPLSDAAHGGVKGRDCVTNAKRHLGKKHHWQTDLKDFYPSITPEMVERYFLRQGFSKGVSRIIAELVTYKNRLPQGAPTSTAIANLVFLSDCGEKIEQICAIHGVTFGTLIDDVTLSAQHDVRAVIGPVAAIINAGGYKLHRGKTKKVTGAIDMPGVRLWNNHLSILPKHQRSIAKAEKGSPRYDGLMGYRKHVTN